MKKALLCLLTLAAMILVVPSAMALTISLYTPANVGITAFDWSVTGTSINLYEKWGAVGRGFVIFDGLESGVDYTVTKHIWNGTGVDWDLFSNELLDPAGQEEDRLHDGPIAPWVPAGFSHSNDWDGLSFAQGSGIPRVSSSFSGVFSDELDTRDFIEFYNGLVSGVGGYEEESFGLRDNNASTGVNEPFLLAQRPNEHSVVPEPGTLMLIGSGLFGLGMARRKK
jgi:hypothetical protein